VIFKFLLIKRVVVFLRKIASVKRYKYVSSRNLNLFTAVLPKSEFDGGAMARRFNFYQYVRFFSNKCEHVAIKIHLSYTIVATRLKISEFRSIFPLYNIPVGCKYL